ncbi:MAG TPA: TIGR01548 family HAD-type hydrolase [Oscillatoriales cyanobacterium M59_W2019_021]|nr:TIGR01548 family HAD-type hydrolase [Oscillatoriales cyanobacterium M4454_W2019_049]HIK50067.1 TIGR01548 family HAD-type hydrolase [Oscillatoriales cyanobacterium M59_W2019_021]
MSQASSPQPPENRAIVVFDIDGVIRDVGGSYRRALADTVEQWTGFRPTSEDIDRLKAEGTWNNDWEASQELIYRYWETQGKGRSTVDLDYEAIVAFFQSRYRGEDPHNPQHWTGYICQEPLLASSEYFQGLDEAGMLWGFFSGATRGSATYILERRLGLQAPVLVAMEDAPGKPDPTGLLAAVAQLEAEATDGAALPVFYAGDTVADLYTVREAAQMRPERRWIGVGVLPPHVRETPQRQANYAALLEKAGAATVLTNIEELNGETIGELLQRQVSTGYGG